MMTTTTRTRRADRPRLVDCAAVEATVAAARRAARPGRSDRLDGYGTLGHLFPQLDDATNETLARSWQEARRCAALLAGGDLDEAEVLVAQAQVAAGRRHLEVLIGGQFRLLRNLVNTYVARRFGSARSEELVEELLGAAYVAAVDAAGTWDPGRGSLPAWVAFRVKAALPTTADRWGRAGSMPGGWSVALALVASAVAELGAGAALADIEARALELRDAQRSDRGGDLDGEDRVRAAIVGNCARMVDVARGTVALDAPVGDDDAGVAYGETLVAAPAVTDRWDPVLAVAFGDADPAVVAVAVDYLFDRPDASWDSVAAGTGVEGLEARRLARRGRARLGAPHAQFAHLAALRVEAA